MLAWKRETYTWNTDFPRASCHLLQRLDACLLSEAVTCPVEVLVDFVRTVRDILCQVAVIRSLAWVQV